MQTTRGMRIGIGVLAFVGAVAWMLPPTTPQTPDGVPQRQKGHSAAAAPPVTAPNAPVPTPNNDAARAVDTNASPAAADAPPLPVERPARPADRPAHWHDPAIGPSDDADDGGAPDPGFAMGYRWAQGNGVEDPHDCRLWRGSAAEDGCRAYLRDAESEDEGVADGPQ